jgi:NAD(P)-dependent dehydrogenase (short-subunit alcohol dehydrogenase family)
MADQINGSSILKDKRAIVFGAAGSIGAAVAREFAAEGAEVFLAGRTRSNIEDVAKQIAKAGGRVHAAAIDATNDVQVDQYVDGIAQHAGSVDIVFNAIGPLASEYGNGKPAVDLAVNEFMAPLTTIVKSQFITARAAARHMIKRRSGVIIFLTGSPARGHVEGVTAIGAAFGAIETFMEDLAVEVSPLGVRAVGIRTTANADSRTIAQMMEALARKMNVPKDQMVARVASMNLLKVPASISDTAKMAAFLASDRARMMTATVVNSTAGAALD